MKKIFNPISENNSHESYVYKNDFSGDAIKIYWNYNKEILGIYSSIQNKISKEFVLKSILEEKVFYNGIKINQIIIQILELPTEFYSLSFILNQANTVISTPQYVNGTNGVDFVLSSNTEDINTLITQHIQNHKKSIYDKYGDIGIISIIENEKVSIKDGTLIVTITDLTNNIVHFVKSAQKILNM